MLYFSFIGISQTLPTTAYIKMIDVWMIFTMILPFLEVSFHACKQIMKQSGTRKTTGKPKKTVGNKQINISVFSCPGSTIRNRMHAGQVSSAGKDKVYVLVTVLYLLFKTFTLLVPLRFPHYFFTHLNCIF